MKTSFLAFAAALALALASCQSSTKPKVPTNLPPEEGASPTADTTNRVK